MTDVVLKTKLNIPPAQINWMSRPRLIRQLNSGIGLKLILVTAPAGFGKTTVLSEWAGSMDRQPSWLSLDDGDNDPMRFWLHFISALQTSDTGVGKVALEMLLAFPRFPIQMCLTALINEMLEQERDFVLILDDYHTIKERSIHASMKFLIDNMPPRMHLVLSSRGKVQFSVGHIRMKNGLIELTAEDLRFTPDEVAVFARKMIGKSLTDDDIKALDTYSEGWVAGLQIAALSIKKSVAGGMPFVHGGYEHMIEYFMDEFLSSHTECIQKFLMDTSIFDSLSGPLCQAVTGQKESAEILEALCASNMLIFPLDHEHHWYRYHNLFADALRSRLRKHDPERIHELHALAGRWFKENGLTNEAIQHAILARDWEYATYLLNKYTGISLLRGEASTALKWLQALPVKRIAKHPGLSVCYAWALYFRNLESKASIPIDVMEQYLDNAEECYSEHQSERGQVNPQEKEIVLGHADALRVFLAFDRGDPPSTFIDLCKRSVSSAKVDILKEYTGIYLLLGMAYMNIDAMEEASRAFETASSKGFARDVYYVVATADCLRAFLAKTTGRLEKAQSICKESLKSIQELYVKPKRLPPDMTGFVQILLIYVLIEKNDLEGADKLLTESINAVRFIRNMFTTLMQNAFLAKIKLIRGADMAEISSYLSNIENLEHTCPGAKSYSVALRIQCLLYRCWNNPAYLEAAIRLAEQSNFESCRKARFYSYPFVKQWHLIEQTTLVRLSIARELVLPRRGSPTMMAETLDFLASLTDRARAKGLGELEIESLMLTALALHASGKDEPALANLSRALSLAEPEGYARIFIDEGKPMADLLRKAIAGGMDTGYAGKLLAGIEAESKGRQQAPSPTSLFSGEVEDLSRQEMVILSLIAEGLSNQEIADKLCVALTTIKTHNYNIFSKLNVKKRYQAVRKARELGLI